MVARLGLVLWHHVTCSLHCYYCKVGVVRLEKTCVLVTYVPMLPISLFESVQLLNIFLCVNKWDNIIKVAIVEPNSYTCQQYLSILCHWTSFSDGVVDATADWPGFSAILYMKCYFVEIPIRYAPLIWRTLRYLFQLLSHCYLIVISLWIAAFEELLEAITLSISSSTSLINI